jgi:cation diffusion facilitator CzcD-associated flavoprotein CzcO
MSKRAKKPDPALTKLRAEVALATFRERVLWSKLVRATNRVAKQRKVVDRLRRKIREREQELGLGESPNATLAPHTAPSPLPPKEGSANGD